MNRHDETIGRRLAAVAVIAGLVGCSLRPDVEIAGVEAEPELRQSEAEPAVRGPHPDLVPVVIAPVGRPATPRGVPRQLSAPRRLAAATPGDVENTAAVAGIRGMLASYAAAFNRHDVAELAAHWTAGGENVDLASGDVTRGREAVRAVFETLFADDAAATIAVDIASIRPVSHGVAVVDGTSRVTFSDGTAAASRFSAVAVEQAGRWVLESVRESPLPGEMTTARPLDQLAWLVGMWEDVGPGQTAATTCDWSPGKAFLVRIHTIRGDESFAEPAVGAPGLLPAEEVVDREVTEILGWDPERETIRSWVFTSAGRFAEGTWSRHGDEWEVRLEGRGADAGTSCGFVVGRGGSDLLTARGPGDGLAAALVPVCDFVRTAR